VTSNGATGSYNAMHDSFQPLGGLVPLLNLLLGDIIYGGLGTGLYGMVFVALVALFIGGLMVGRTPEHMGHRLGAPEMKIVAVYTLIGPATVLVLTALAVLTQAGRDGLTTNTGAHGLTEILFAYASALANNGQSMAGLSANSVFYNVTTIAAMLIGRWGLAIPALALAGRFAAISRRPPSAGTMPSDGVQFGVLLAASAVLIGALNFLPVLALGPLLEYFSAH
jgi:K+-transporting ATPase ATPase A chain